jgi:hypothetical protein
MALFSFGSAGAQEPDYTEPPPETDMPAEPPVEGDAPISEPATEPVGDVVVEETTDVVVEETTTEVVEMPEGQEGGADIEAAPVEQPAEPAEIVVVEETTTEVIETPTGLEGGADIETEPVEPSITQQQTAPAPAPPSTTQQMSVPAPAPTAASSRPQSAGTGAVSPPSTGDAGLADEDPGIPATLMVVAGALSLALTAGLVLRSRVR